MYLRRVKDLRTDHDLTQIELSKKLGISVSVYRRYEWGERDLPLWIAIELSEL